MLKSDSNETTKAIWLSIDLDLKADYDGLYAWLDSYDARECAGSLAFISFPYKSNIVDEIVADIKKNVEIGKRDRIYMIYRNGEGKMKGVWLFGNRKAPAWSGYSSEQLEKEDEE